MDNNFITGGIAFLICIAIIICIALWADRRNLTIKSLLGGVWYFLKELFITTAMGIAFFAGLWLVGFAINSVRRLLNV